MRSFRCSVLSMMETEGKNYFTHPCSWHPSSSSARAGRRCDSRSNHRSAASRANVRLWLRPDIRGDAPRCPLSARKETLVTLAA